MMFVTACTPPQPPAAPAPVSATPVSASFGKAWDAVIDVFAQRNIPIKTIERASGFIATDPLAVAIQRDGKPHAWADCGKAIFGGYFPPTNATYNVRVKGDSTRSTVQISVLWRYAPPEGTIMAGPGNDCSTKGVWEAEATAAIKRTAEAK